MPGEAHANTGTFLGILNLLPHPSGQRVNQELKASLVIMPVAVQEVPFLNELVNASPWLASYRISGSASFQTTELQSLRRT